MPRMSPTHLPRLWPGSTASDRSARPGGATDDALGSETVNDWSGVERDNSSDRRPSIGDDDVVAITRSVDPLPEVSSEFRDRYIHTR